jgi:hypothetical protein
MRKVVTDVHLVGKRLAPRIEWVHQLAWILLWLVGDD